MNAPTLPSSKTLTAVTTVGLGVIGCLAFGYHLMNAIPQTNATVQEIKDSIERAVLPGISAIGPKLEEGNRISCATCWNAAQSEEEIRRCSCNPDK